MLSGKGTLEVFGTRDRRQKGRRPSGFPSRFPATRYRPMRYALIAVLFLQSCTPPTQSLGSYQDERSDLTLAYDGSRVFFGEADGERFADLFHEAAQSGGQEQTSGCLRFGGISIVYGKDPKRTCGTLKFQYYQLGEGRSRVEGYCIDDQNNCFVDPSFSTSLMIEYELNDGFVNEFIMYPASAEPIRFLHREGPKLGQ